MPQTDNDLLNQLIQLLNRIYADTAQVLQSPGELQVWYDRGYADGMAAVLSARYPELSLPQPLASAAEVAEAASLNWGEAYRHGLSMGEKESLGVLPPESV